MTNTNMVWRTLLKSLRLYGAHELSVFQYNSECLQTLQQQQCQSNAKRLQKGSHSSRFIKAASFKQILWFAKAVSSFFQLNFSINNAKHILTSSFTIQMDLKQTSHPRKKTKVYSLAASPGPRLRMSRRKFPDRHSPQIISCYYSLTWVAEKSKGDDNSLQGVKTVGKRIKHTGFLFLFTSSYGHQQ